jgi:hypothetical protein
MRGAAFIDQSRHLARTDKSNGLDARMIADGLHNLPVPMNHRENALREPSLLQEPGNLDGTKRRLLRRFQNEGVAATNGHRNHPQGHHERKVEGSNAGHHAERIAHHLTFHAATHFEDTASNQLREATSKLHTFDGARNAGACFACCLAVFLAADFRELFHLRFDQGLQAVEYLDSLVHGLCSPALLRLHRFGHGDVQFRGPAQG